MIQQQTQRVEHEITKMFDDMDKTYFRKMQIQMHLCAIKCCEDQSSSIEKVQRCVETCSVPLTRAQRYFHSELDNYNDRLQRCVKTCNDQVKDKMPVNPTESDIAKYTSQFERCAVRCVDEHVDLIPNMVKKIKAVLSQGPTSIPEV